MPKISVVIEVPEGRQCGCCHYWSGVDPAVVCKIYKCSLKTDDRARLLKCAECLEACGTKPYPSEIADDKLAQEYYDTAGDYNRINMLVNNLKTFRSNGGFGTIHIIACAKAIKAKEKE